MTNDILREATSPEARAERDAMRRRRQRDPYEQYASLDAQIERRRAELLFRTAKGLRGCMAAALWVDHEEPSK